MKSKVIALPQAAKAGNGSAPHIHRHQYELSIAKQPREQSDAGQMELVKELYGDKLLFDRSLNKWLSYNGVYWKLDDGETIQRCLISAARLRKEAAESIPDDPQKTRDKEMRFATGCANYSRISNVDRLLRNVLEAPPPDAWEADPWLLATPSGVVDLRTGLIVPSDPTQYIAKLTTVGYDPTATCTRYPRAVSEIFGNDPAVVDWVGRFIGYSITGLTHEQLWGLGFGDGSNGKDVLVGTVRTILGSYADTADSATFMDRQQPTDGAAPAPDVVRLARLRFVEASETTARPINHQRIKNMTGGPDCQLKPRDLYGKPVAFHPRFKLWLHTNAKPLVRDTSYGFWRRVAAIPFDVRFDEHSTPPKDPELQQKLKAEYSGILTLLVKWAGEYHRRGLRPFPEKVRQFIAEYQDENDIVGSFLSERAEDAPAERVKSSTAYKIFKSWCREQGTADRYIISDQTFATEMKKRYRKAFYNGIPHYYGLRLKSDPFSMED